MCSYTNAFVPYDQHNCCGFIVKVFRVLTELIKMPHIFQTIDLAYFAIQTKIFIYFDSSTAFTSDVI